MKNIKDYSNYFISEDGEVYSKKQNELHKLKPYHKSTGHTEVSLWENNEGKTHYVHRLVAEAYIPNPEGKTMVHHIDHNPKNNKVSNLRWVTPKENQRISWIENGRISSQLGKFGYDSARGKEVIQLDYLGKTIKIYATLTEAEKETSIAKGNICRCCQGNRTTAGGYKWKYKEGPY